MPLKAPVSCSIRSQWVGKAHPPPRKADLAPGLGIKGEPAPPVQGCLNNRKG